MFQIILYTVTAILLLLLIISLYKGRSIKGFKYILLVGPIILIISAFGVYYDAKSTIKKEEIYLNYIVAAIKHDISLDFNFKTSDEKSQCIDSLYSICAQIDEISKRVQKQEIFAGKQDEIDKQICNAKKLIYKTIDIINSLNNYSKSSEMNSVVFDKTELPFEDISVNPLPISNDSIFFFTAKFLDKNIAKNALHIYIEIVSKNDLDSIYYSQLYECKPIKNVFSIPNFTKQKDVIMLIGVIKKNEENNKLKYYYIKYKYE